MLAAVGTRFMGMARTWSRTDMWVRVLVLSAALAAVAVVWLLRGRLTGVDWAVLGYPGVFSLSFLGAVAMVLPVPGLISVCGVSVFLNPLVVGIVAGVGETLGETSGYAVGYGGKAVVEHRPLYRKMKRWMELHGTLLVFAVSIIPNPLVDVVGIAAGATRFPFGRFMATVLVGKMLKGVMVAYTCYHGIKLLPWVS